MGSAPQLPAEFDVVVVGTGLEESMVAAAAARNGHTVLHLDHEDYYGGDWAAFNLDGIQDWIRKQKKEDRVEDDDDGAAENEPVLCNGETLLRLTDVRLASDVEDEWFVGGGDDDEEEGDSDGRKRWTKSRILGQSRKFNLDLTARLLYARGAMVDLLISSNISRYAEFKSVSRVLARMPDGGLDQVPSSRADVFATKRVSVVEKRILMKFIAFCVDYESKPEAYEPFRGRTFLEFLKREKLTENLIGFVLNSIAMVDGDAPCVEGLEATKKFLTSVGRFGNTPFLWSMYGSGELPQAFCRLCAVFGGVYVLGKPIRSVVVEGGSVKAVVFNGQRIGCKKLVVDSRRWPKEAKGAGAAAGAEVVLRRKVCMLSDSIFSAEKEQLTFVNVPAAEGGAAGVFVEEVGFGTAACPKGMYVLHMTTEGDGGKLKAEDVLSDSSRLMWSLDFKNVVEKHAKATTANAHLCSGPLFELDYDAAIANAKNAFRDMFPDEEFLPRAPDPEEVIVGGEALEGGKETEVGKEPNTREVDGAEKPLEERGEMAKKEPEAKGGDEAEHGAPKATTEEELS